MFCPHCGKPIASEANFCSVCGAAANHPANPISEARIVRPRYPRAVAGVCAGFAMHYGWDLNLTRILFAVITCFTSGIGILVYLALWVLLPDAQFTLPPEVANRTYAGQQNTPPGF